jgi:hypothetical protein|tara:strand:+ start:764 stop:1018 length:255 start_codon:yes stop_codon:yes gene_type:complete
MPKYQKRHYVDIAKLLNRHVQENLRVDIRDYSAILESEQRMIHDFTALFGRDNPLFNPDTFKRAVYEGSSVDLKSTVHIPHTRY